MIIEFNKNTSLQINSPYYFYRRLFVRGWGIYFSMITSTDLDIIEWSDNKFISIMQLTDDIKDKIDDIFRMHIII